MLGSCVRELNDYYGSPGAHFLSASAGGCWVVLGGVGW